MQCALHGFQINKKAIVLEDKKGKEAAIIIWINEKKDIYISSEYSNKKGIEYIETLIEKGKVDGEFSAQFYAENNLEKLFSEKMSDLNIFAMKKSFLELCSVIKKEVSVELATLPQDMTLTEIMYLIMQYLCRWCIADNLLESKTVEPPKPQQLLGEDIELFKKIAEKKLNYIVLDKLKSYHTFFNQENINDVLKKLSQLDLETLADEIKIEYYKNKKERIGTGVTCIEIFQKIY